MTKSPNTMDESRRQTIDGVMRMLSEPSYSSQMKQGQDEARRRLPGSPRPTKEFLEMFGIDPARAGIQD